MICIEPPWGDHILEIGNWFNRFRYYIWSNFGEFDCTHALSPLKVKLTIFIRANPKVSFSRERFKVSFSRAPLKFLFVEHPFVYGDVHRAGGVCHQDASPGILLPSICRTCHCMSIYAQCLVASNFP